MNGFSTLLNFYLMSHINTGSALLDMLLVMLIPLVYDGILKTLEQCLLLPLQRLAQHFLRGKAKTSIIANYNTMHGVSLDLNENLVLQEALMHYVGHMVKPTYPFGSYRFTRLAAKGPTARSNSLVDTLRHTYFLQTIPSSQAAVELAPGLSLRIFNDDGQKKDENARRNGMGSLQAGGGPTTTPNQRGKGAKTYRKTTLVLETNANAFTREDAVMTFTQKAFQAYKNSIKRAMDSERYLFQPLLPQGGMGEGKVGVAVRPTMCQRYPLSLEKTFNTLFFPEKEKLIHLIHQFETRSGKFAVPGFPHKLILLLYGPPGTGKTSLVKAIAAHTKRHILSIPLSHIKTNRELLNLMYDGRFSVVNGKFDNETNRHGAVECLRPDKVVYMLEDIDAASEVVRNAEKVDSSSAEKKGEGESKAPSSSTINEDMTTAMQACNKPTTDVSEDTTSDKCKSQPRVEKVIIPAKSKYQRLLEGVVEDPLSLKGLFEAFGGILDAPGRIVVLTTNHVDYLAPALLKPGIITMKLYMGNFSAECGIQMVKHYFRSDLEDNPKEDEDNNDATAGENPFTEEDHRSRQETLEEIGNVILAAQKSGAGFSPAEVEQMCAENNSLQELLVALKRGSRTEFF
ncbi:unnamed protein product, partial [Phytomonas sp. EM1]